jgi:hypothetical protein
MRHFRTPATNVGNQNPICQPIHSFPDPNVRAVPLCNPVPPVLNGFVWNEAGVWVRFEVWVRESQCGSGSVTRTPNAARLISPMCNRSLCAPYCECPTNQAHRLSRLHPLGIFFLKHEARRKLTRPFPLFSRSIAPLRPADSRSPLRPCRRRLPWPVFRRLHHQRHEWQARLRRPNYCPRELRTLP